MRLADKKNCACCGEEFFTHNRKKKYCSQECQLVMVKQRVNKANKEIREMRIKNRRCVSCDTDLEETEKNLTCKSCRDRINDYYRNLRLRKEGKEVEGVSTLTDRIQKIERIRKIREEQYSRDMIGNNVDIKKIILLKEGYLYKLNGKLVRLIEDRLVPLTELELIKIVEGFVNQDETD